MKRILVVSLFLNLTLAGVMVWQRQHQPAGAAEKTSADNSAAAAVKPVPARADPSAPLMPVADAQKPAQAFDWRLVESEDYKKYIANLRSIGCPEETIRDIITADVNKLFESRRRGGASTNRYEYWKTGNMFGDMMNPERLEKNQALAQEKRDLLKELLGVAPEEKVDLFSGMNPFETMLDFLPSAKQNQVMEAYTKYQAKVAKAFSGGSVDAEDMKQMQKLQKEMDVELATIMTPDEFKNYQLRMSQTAMTMRSQLSGFDPSEQEFQNVFAIRKKFDDEFGMFGMSSGDKAERDKYMAAQKDMNGEIKNMLGDTRYAEYERAQDYVYQTISRVADRNGLPKDVAVKVYDMKKAAEDEANKVRSNAALSREQKQEALSGIRAETEKAMESTLGHKAWDAYNKPNNTYWMNNISRPASTQSPAVSEHSTVIINTP